MADFFQRNLPHYHQPNATYFITFRLAGSLPVEIWKNLKEEYEQEKRNLATRHSGAKLQEERYNLQKRHFARFDALLENDEGSPRWLAEPQFADIVQRELHTLSPEHYNLHSYCLMPNHCHLLINQQDIQEPPLPIDGKHYTSLSHVMRLLKGRTGYTCTKLLGRKGAFWQHESYDHVVRDDREFTRILDYIVNNPVKAGLVEKWQDWSYTYVNPNLL
ncbi:MAG: transposase [Anaerolineales bacterium]|uniref:transposase n=1 Tax=Candidatus Villigracilis vicinus TaxID=3140679 RepID=UPI0031359CCD|nr:transposase [Anaerolineales bacterium]